MAEGLFPSPTLYLKEWSIRLIEELRQSAIKEMQANKSKAKFPGAGDPQASTLVAGMRTSMTIFGTKVEADIILPRSWEWLEHGRKPGKMPPEQPIIRWMVHRGIKGLPPRKVKGIKNRTVRKGLRQLSVEKSRKQLAFLIRRKIGRDGTRATHFFSNVVTKELLNDLTIKLKDRYKKDITFTLITEA